jgi:hypothetical protein
MLLGHVDCILNVERSGSIGIANVLFVTVSKLCELLTQKYRGCFNPQVLRVLIPLYVTLLPQEFWQRWTSILLLGGATYIILLALKILVGLGLQMHAAWYLKRCRYKEAHPHAD